MTAPPVHSDSLRPARGPARVLVTGATGYIGGRLVPELLAAGHQVRVVVRHPERLSEVPWRDQVEVVQGDLNDADDVGRALRPQSADNTSGDIDVLFYLVHSMGTSPHFEQAELAMARTVAGEATRAGVRRIVYLGGLHPDHVRLSEHMRSRQAVGDVLLGSGVPTIMFRAGVVIGSGSASFEMIRHLTENLPVMPAPSWVRHQIEPIAIRDVLHYLVHAISIATSTSHTFDIGSREVLTYAGLMYGYMHEARLPRRRIYSLPIPAPRLAGWWVALVTPIPHAMAVPLVQSLQHDAVTQNRAVDAFVPFPDGGLMPYRAAVRLALNKMTNGEVETTWANAMTRTPADPLPSDPDWAGQSVFVDERERTDAHADVADVWDVIEGVGGANGWYSLPVAWAVRGVLDKLVGGVGGNRGRRNPRHLVVGDAVDWWRVETIERGRLLRLRAEMRVPGGAWLEMAAEPVEGGGTRYRQRAIYFPRGLLGKAYWWAIAPFHMLIFPAMARNILARARATRAGSGENTQLS